jgi:phospholipid/cholesterol/gamma-HCH transport system substrate-binding protein
MTDERRLDFRVGAFVLTGAVVLGIVLFTIGTGRHLFGETYHLVARFPDIAGLAVGAPVRLAGVTVGTVTRIAVAEELQVRTIEVALAINRAVQARIREDSVASIQTLGVLGDKYVELTMGTETRPPLSPGAEVTAVPPPNLYAWMQRGEAMLTDPSVYDGVQALLLGGANRRWLLRWVVRHALKQSNQHQGELRRK